MLCVSPQSTRLCSESTQLCDLNVVLIKLIYTTIESIPSTIRTQHILLNRQSWNKRPAISDGWILNFTYMLCIAPLRSANSNGLIQNVESGVYVTIAVLQSHTISIQILQFANCKYAECHCWTNDWTTGLYHCKSFLCLRQSCIPAYSSPVGSCNW